MGYRSKVCIRTTLEGVKLIEREWDAKASSTLQEEASQIYAQGDVSTIVFDEIKWDAEAYPEILAVEELLNADDLHGQPFSLVRIGEDMGDYEVECCEAIEKGGAGLERFRLYANQYIEGDDMLPVLPDFNLREFALLIMMLYTRMEQLDPQFTDAMKATSKLLSDMVDERDRQSAEEAGNE